MTSAGIMPGIPGILAVGDGSLVLVGLGMSVVFVGFAAVTVSWEVWVEEGEMIVMHRLLIMHIEQVMMITIRMVERSERFFRAAFLGIGVNCWLVSWFSRAVPTGMSSQMP